MGNFFSGTSSKPYNRLKELIDLENSFWVPLISALKVDPIEALGAAPAFR